MTKKTYFDYVAPNGAEIVGVLQTVIITRRIDGIAEDGSFDLGEQADDLGGKTVDLDNLDLDGKLDYLDNVVIDWNTAQSVPWASTAKHNGQITFVDENDEDWPFTMLVKKSDWVEPDDDEELADRVADAI